MYSILQSLVMTYHSNEGMCLTGTSVCKHLFLYHFSPCVTTVPRRRLATSVSRHQPYKSRSRTDGGVVNLAASSFSGSLNPAHLSHRLAVKPADHLYVVRYGRQFHAIVLNDFHAACLVEGHDMAETLICVVPLTAWLRGLRPVKVQYPPQQCRTDAEVVQRALRLAHMPGMASLFPCSEDFARFCKSIVVPARISGRMVQRVGGQGQAGSLVKALLVVLGWLLCTVTTALLGRTVGSGASGVQREAAVAMLAAGIAVTIVSLWQP